MTDSKIDDVKMIASHAFTELSLPQQTHARCMVILEDRRTKELLTEKNVAGIVAGAIYIAAILTENRLSQNKISDIMGVSVASIRKYYVLLVNMLGIRKND
jgi:transcription initiation factor TFIIB